jgi:hypothetical protein
MTFAVGARVRVKALPADVDSFPPESQAAFAAALGKVFTVRGHGPYGHLEIVLGRALDRRLGGYGNTIWIEPELAEVAPPSRRRKRAETQRRSPP